MLTISLSGQCNFMSNDLYLFLRWWRVWTRRRMQIEFCTLEPVLKKLKFVLQCKCKCKWKCAGQIQKSWFKNRKGQVQYIFSSYRNKVISLAVNFCESAHQHTIFCLIIKLFNWWLVLEDRHISTPFNPTLFGPKQIKTILFENKLELSKWELIFNNEIILKCFLLKCFSMSLIIRQLFLGVILTWRNHYQQLESF